MKVLIIPEDFRKDQYILQPIIEKMMDVLGKPSAKVQVCQAPLLGGFSEAMKLQRIEEIIKRYRWAIDIFILCIDRDGVQGRRAALNVLEQRVSSGELLGPNRMFLAENAWQELEVWALAGHDLPAGWSWETIREELNPKELYFDVLVDQRGLSDEPGGGRRTLSQEAARRYDRIRQLCPEDVANLESRLREWLAQRQNPS